VEKERSLDGIRANLTELISLIQKPKSRNNSHNKCPVCLIISSKWCAYHFFLQCGDGWLMAAAGSGLVSMTGACGLC
jgi:hypothetical protein